MATANSARRSAPSPVVGSGRGREGKPTGEVEVALLDGRYRFIRPLGSGAFAEVFEAENARTGGRVAIKVIDFERASVSTGLPARTLRARFRREAHALGTLSHPNTVRLYDAGEGAKSAFLVMEFIRGGSLGDRIASEKVLGVGASLEIARQIASALEESHALGIVHRDLKPDNVLLVNHPGHPSFVRVVDFGIARLLERTQSSDAVTGQGEAVGTPEYMSPEQCMGLPVDARSDLYSLGIIVWEMLTGRMPFRGRTHITTMALHISEPLPPLQIPGHPPGSYPGIEGLLQICLSKEAAHRFQVAGAMRRALEDCIASHGAGR